jgi:transcriptional regulator with XRE-family HTH domain
LHKRNYDASTFLVTVAYTQHRSRISACHHPHVPKPPPEYKMNRARLLAALKSRNATQEELASAVGVDPSQVSRWLEGQVPNGDAFYKVCRFLSCSPAYLLGRDEVEIRAYLSSVVGNEIDASLVAVVRDIPGSRRLPLVEASPELKGRRIRKIVSERPQTRAALENRPQRDQAAPPRRPKRLPTEKPVDDEDES